MPDTSLSDAVREAMTLCPTDVREIHTLEIYQPAPLLNPWSLQFIDYVVGDARHTLLSGTTWDASENFILFCQTAHNSQLFDIAIDNTDRPTDHANWASAGQVWAYAGSWIREPAFVATRHFHNNGVIYLCLIGHNKVAHDAEPGVGAEWETYWRVAHTIDPYPPILWEYAAKYYIGDIVSLLGTRYTCILDHYRDDAVLTEPGVGSDWETYWAAIPLPERLFLVNDNVPLTAYLETPEVGDPELVTYETRSFKVNVADSGEDGVKGINITIDNTDLQVSKYLAAAAKNPYPVEITVRVYLSNNLHPQNDPPIVLYLGPIEIKGSTVSGEARWVDIQNAPFPNSYYNRTRFPGL